MRLVEELRVARSAKTRALQELRAVKGAQPAGTAAPLMITAAAATDEDVWPVSSRPPPAVPEGIRRVALEEISAADVAECGCHFAPWYTPYFLAEQRVAARMQHAQTLEAQRLAQLRRDNDALQARVARLEALTAPEGPLIKGVADALRRRVASL
jgi:hypothetical protein